MILLQGGYLASHPVKRRRRKGGRMSGTGGSLEGWGWGLWGMRISLILREYTNIMFCGSWVGYLAPKLSHGYLVCSACPYIL